MAVRHGKGAIVTELACRAVRGAGASVEVGSSTLAPEGIVLVTLAPSRGGHEAGDGDGLALVHLALAQGPTIVDVAALLAADVAVTAQVLAELADAHREATWCVVAGRMSARRQLAGLGGPVRICLFTTVADALQVWRMHRDGYGAGWSVSGGDGRRGGRSS